MNENKYRISRRHFLALAGTSTAAAMLAAYVSQAAPESGQEEQWKSFCKKMIGMKVTPVNLPNCNPIVGEIYHVGMEYYEHTGWFPYASVKFEEYDRQICLENLKSVDLFLCPVDGCEDGF